MKLLFLLLFSLPLFAKEAPVVFKKGMLITCPKNHKPAYKVISTIRQGSPIQSKDIVFYKTNKHPKPDDLFICDSVVMSWKGVCIHSNLGWLPKECQVGLRVKLEFEPVVE